MRIRRNIAKFMHHNSHVIQMSSFLKRIYAENCKIIRHGWAKRQPMILRLTGGHIRKAGPFVTLLSPAAVRTAVLETPQSEFIS